MAQVGKIRAGLNSRVDTRLTVNVAAIDGLDYMAGNGAGIEMNRAGKYHM